MFTGLVAKNTDREGWLSSLHLETPTPGAPMWAQHLSKGDAPTLPGLGMGCLRLVPTRTDYGYHTAYENDNHPLSVKSRQIKYGTVILNGLYVQNTQEADLLFPWTVSYSCNLKRPTEKDGQSLHQVHCSSWAIGTRKPGSPWLGKGWQQGQSCSCLKDMARGHLASAFFLILFPPKSPGPLHPQNPKHFISTDVGQDKQHLPIFRKSKAKHYISDVRE